MSMPELNSLQFDDHEISATIEGGKTLFRMPVNPQPPTKDHEIITVLKDGNFYYQRLLNEVGQRTAQAFEMPLSQGQRFFIKEDFIIRPHTSETHKIIYRAGYSGGLENKIAWQTALNMPGLYSRLELIVKTIRTEYLHDITEDQAQKDGVKPYVHAWSDDVILEIPNYQRETPYRNGFINSWDLMLGSYPKFCWAANPLVWVIEFEKVNAN